MISKGVLQTIQGLLIHCPQWQEVVRVQVLEQLFKSNEWPEPTVLIKSILEAIFTPVICSMDLTQRLDSLVQEPGQHFEDYVQRATQLWQIIKPLKAITSAHAGRRFLMGLRSAELKRHVNMLTSVMQMQAMPDSDEPQLVLPHLLTLSFERCVLAARSMHMQLLQHSQEEERIEATSTNTKRRRSSEDTEYVVTGIQETPFSRSNHHTAEQPRKKRSNQNERGPQGFKRKQSGQSPLSCVKHPGATTHDTADCKALIAMRAQLREAPQAIRFNQTPCLGCADPQHNFKSCPLGKPVSTDPMVTTDSGPGKHGMPTVSGNMIAPFLTAVGRLIQQAKDPDTHRGPLIVAPRLNEIDGQAVRAFIDTGCTEHSFVTERFCIEHKIIINKDVTVTQVLADKTSRPAIGLAAPFTLYYNGRSRAINAIAVEEMLFTDLTLGCDDSIHLGIITITTENPLLGADPGFLTDLEQLQDIGLKAQSETTDPEASTKMAEAIKDLMEENQKITGFANVPPVRLNLKTDEAIYIPQYPISNKEEVRAQIAKWLAAGKIRVCKPGETRNNLPITTAGKFDNRGQRVGTRVCLDPRAVNKITDQADFPIPTVRNVIDGLLGNRYFTELDLEDAFMQLQLHEDDQNTLAFTFEGTTYAFIGSPYGLHFLTAEFQKRIATGLHGCPARPYVDNISIGSATLEEHIVHVRQVIERLNELKFKISAKKTKLAQTAIDILGLRVSAEGVAPDPAKVEGILAWPFPDSHKALLCFLGIVNFMRTHIRHITELCEPLNRARASPRDFAREISTNKQAMMDACERIKQAIAAAPILRWPDKDLKFHIATDGSRVGIGAVLFQPSAEQVARGDYSITADNIVMFASRALKRNERNYSTYKLEALALVYAVDSFHHLIYGQEFVVHTDHSALLHLREHSEQQRTLGSWLLRLSEYRFTIQHVRGEFNVLPDCLSRLYAKSAAWGVPQERGRPPVKPLVKLDERIMQPVLDQFQAHMDKINQRDRTLSATFAARHIAKQTAAEKEELIRMTGRTIPAESERATLLTSTHARGHYGERAMLADLFHEQRLWWPNMGSEVQKHVSTCEECLRWNAANVGYHPLKSPSVGLPGEYWQVDLLTLPQTTEGHNYVLIVLDLFTGFCVGRALKTKAASEVAYHLYHIISEWGPPRILHTDEGPEFCNAIINELVNTYKVKQKIAPAYNHRSIGAVERLNRTIRNCLLYTSDAADE